MIDSAATPVPEPVRVTLPENPRAVWVVRDALTSPTRIRRMVDDAAKAGVTDLIVQVRGRGDAYYESRIVMTPPMLGRAFKHNGRFDPLRMVLDQAHARGLRVHAWLNVYLVWGKGTPPGDHIISRHPEWVAVDRREISMADMSFKQIVAARTEGIHLEPGNRDVVRHFLRVVHELLTSYEVDGIHLDYCRYPMMDVGYSPTMRAGFRRLSGVDPLEFFANETRLVEEWGTDGYMQLQRAWRQFKADQVTALVASVHRLRVQMRPDLVISTAVKPDPYEALEKTGQDWLRWVEDGYVDVVAPMMYSTSQKTVRRQATLLASLVPQNRVWAGIAVYNQSLDAAASKIQTVRNLGFGGVSIFSYNSIPGGVSSLKRLNELE
jgi:uncharacterized lipoprotein YddW (UPF0748 family)